MAGEVSGDEGAPGPQAVGGAENLDHNPARRAGRRGLPRRRPRLAIAHQRRAAGVVEAEEATDQGAGEEQDAIESGVGEAAAAFLLAAREREKGVPPRRPRAPQPPNKCRAAGGAPLANSAVSH